MLRYLNMFDNGEVTNLQNMGQANSKSRPFFFSSTLNVNDFVVKRGKTEMRKAKSLVTRQL